MRNLKCGIFFLVLVCAFVPASFAHPPSEIELFYDEESGTLNAVITHPVSNPDRHYIDMVHIGLNGMEVEELEFTKQDSPAAQEIRFAWTDLGHEALKPGDRVSLEAYCNISGKLSKTITIT